MAFKIFHIGKANERIDVLETENAELKQEIETLKGNDSAVVAAAETVKGELSAASAKIVQLESDLSTARASIGSLTAERDAAATSLKAAEAKLANPSAQIKELASTQAMEIMAKLGQPPIVMAPKTEPGAEKKEATGRDRFLSTIKIEGQK